MELELHVYHKKRARYACIKTAQWTTKKHARGAQSTWRRQDIKSQNSVRQTFSLESAWKAMWDCWLFCRELAFADEMTLPVKFPQEFVELCYQNGMTDAEILCCYHLVLKPSPETLPMYLANSAWFNKEIRRNWLHCHRRWSSRSTVPEDILMAVYHIVTSGYIQWTSGAAYVFDLPKTMVLATALWNQHVSIPVPWGISTTYGFCKWFSCPIWQW